MVELRVGSDAVRAAGSRAQALMDEFLDALGECDRMSASLVGQSWSGPASAVFQSGWAEWHRGASEVQAALAGIAKLLDESATQYEANRVGGHPGVEELVRDGRGDRPMTRFHINTDDLEVTVAALNSMAILCERLLTEVDSLAVAASAEWTGEASEQFLALKAEWADGARLMSEGVQVIHQAATESNANYLAVADAAARVWR